MINIIIVDNHPLFASGLKSLFEQTEGYHIIDTVDNGRSLQTLLQNNRNVDLILLDLNLGKEDGIEVIGELKKKGFKQKILVLTSYESPRIIGSLKDQLIQGYAKKTLPFDELLEAIKTIHEGGTFFDNSSLAETDKSFTINYSDDFIKRYRLTKREYEVFICLARSFSTKEIATLLDLTESTVSTYRKYVKAKLKLKTTAEIVRYAFENQLL